MTTFLSEPEARPPAAPTPDAAPAPVDGDRTRAHSPAHARPVRVLHLLPDLQIGGGQTIVLNHLRHADRSRFDLTVAALTHQAGTGATMADEFATTLGRPVIDLGHGVRAGDLTTVTQLVRLIQRERIDLLHVHSDVDRKLGQVAALATKIPVVGHLHAEWVHLGPMSPTRATRARQVRARVLANVRDRVERRTVRHYIAESDRVRQIFQPLVGQPIDVLSQAIPSERFEAVRASRPAVRAELDIAPDAPVIICVSRLVPGKGQHHLLEAFASLRATWPDLALVLVGDGELRPRFEAMAGDLGVADAVRFLGDRHDVPDLLGAADVFAFASETEGFGLCVLEAMAASLPVVAMRCAALEEFMAEGSTGDLVPQGDVPALAAALDALLLDPRRGRRYGKDGRTVVLERFAPTAVARSFEAVYDQVMAAPRPRTAQQRRSA